MLYDATSDREFHTVLRGQRRWLVFFVHIFSPNGLLAALLELKLLRLGRPFLLTFLLEGLCKTLVKNFKVWNAFRAFRFKAVEELLSLRTV